MIATLKDANVLVAGAGAIGCEVIKCVVFEDVKRLLIVDFDVISVTNLHRQALFRPSDCGKHKAERACAWAIEYCRRLERTRTIESLVGRIESVSMNELRRFDVVISALDDARAMRVLSRRCFAARVPVVACNTNARLASAVRVWAPSVTPCFDCRYPNASFDQPPVDQLPCAARFRSKTVGDATRLATIWLADAHRLVVAAAVEPTPPPVDVGDNGDNAAATAALVVAAANEMQPSMSSERWCELLFNVRVVKYMEVTGALMRDMKVPTADARGDALRSIVGGNGSLTEEACDRLEHCVMTPVCAMAVFIAAIDALRGRNGAGESASWLFDKDDAWHRVFVGAAATLQCYTSLIQPQTTFAMVAHVAQVAPASPAAAATAGAIGVLEAMRLLSTKDDANAKPSRDLWSSPAFDEHSDTLVCGRVASLPSTDCVTCGKHDTVIATRQCTVSDLRTLLLARSSAWPVDEIMHGETFTGVLFSYVGDADQEKRVLREHLAAYGECIEVDNEWRIRVEFVDIDDSNTVWWSL